MKVLLSILPIALFVFGCGNTESKPNLTNTAPEKDPMESAVEWSKLQNRNGDAYIPNTDKPYSGWAKQDYDNGQVKVLAEFTDGSVTRLRQWQRNGIPMWDFRYLKGKVSLSDVPLERYWASDSSLQHGPITLWYENGQKKEEENYKDGELDGLLTWWYENGQKKVEETFKDGKWDGLATVWFDNGQKSREETFKDGKMVSATAWKPNGEKCPITNIVDGNGVIVRYREDGTENYRYSYKDGELVEDVSYREDGTVGFRHIWKDGKQVDSVSYREDGTVSERYTYKKGELVEFVSYREDGTVGERNTFKDGELVDD